MQTYASPVSRRGQVTIPAEVRRLLSIRPGDRIEFHVQDEVVTLRRAAFTLETAFESVPPLSGTEDFEAQIRRAKESRYVLGSHL